MIFFILLQFYLFMDNLINLNFFNRSPETVAKELLGKYFVKLDNGLGISAKIVETEAYLSKGDLSSHSASGPTKRNLAMFEKAGTIYVYKIYGIHFCLNFVTEMEGIGSAVLIRAAEPVSGIEIMKKNRNIFDDKLLCKGPANLTKSFGINTEDNRKILNMENLFIYEGREESQFNIKTSKRIGISKSADLLLRFYIEGSKYVSGKKN